jgi:hypothetical protein
MSIHSWINWARRNCTDRALILLRCARRSAMFGPAWLAAAAGTLAFAPMLNVGAQEARSTPSDPQLPRYRVEILIFENLQSPPHPEDPGRPPIPEGLSTVPGIFVEQAEPLPQSAPAAGEPLTEPPEPETTPIFFEPADMQDLADIASTLDRNPGYRVLAHESWRQPGFARDQAGPVDLETVTRLRTITTESGGVPIRPAASAVTGVSPDKPLVATVTLWLGRYLHLVVDAESFTASGPGHLSESRRMRSGELHYFDSPRLGAIAIVVPEETANDVAEDSSPEDAPVTGPASR